MHRDEPPEWALPAWDALSDHDFGPAARADASRANPPGTVGLRVLGVSDVTRIVRELLRGDPRLRDLWVEGEIGRVTVSSAGHAYFTLKDERTQLSCVWFRDDRLASPFEAQTGLRVVAHGRLDVFDQQGVYQLYVEALQPAGFGDLALQFEALKARLAAEGLFDVARKRPIPDRPATIAVVTSLSGAVWHDIRTVIERRWPLVEVLIAPCQVQGDGAPASIVAALRRVARWGEQADRDGRPRAGPQVTIVARGGGSIEDLWGFNDERVVRAVAAHPIPVVSGVGHEVDVTLVDFAADVRAPTPSAAAELVVPDRADLARLVEGHRRRLDARIVGRLDGLRSGLAQEGRVLERLSPTAMLDAARERSGLLLDRATSAVLARITGAHQREQAMGERLARPIVERVAEARASLGARTAALAALGPQATLDRGYAIVRRAEDDQVVRDPAAAPAGTLLSVRVARGTFAARTEDPAKPAEPTDDGARPTDRRDRARR